MLVIVQGIYPSRHRGAHRQLGSFRQGVAVLVGRSGCAARPVSSWPRILTLILPRVRLTRRSSRTGVPGFAIRAGERSNRSLYARPSGPEVGEAEGDRIEGADAHRVVVLRARNEQPLAFVELERFEGAVRQSRIPSHLPAAVECLRELNRSGRRKLSDIVPVPFEDFRHAPRSQAALHWTKRGNAPWHMRRNGRFGLVFRNTDAAVRARFDRSPRQSTLDFNDSPDEEQPVRETEAPPVPRRSSRVSSGLEDRYIRSKSSHPVR